MKYSYLLIVIFLMTGSVLMAQDFKVIGYLPYYRFSLNEKIHYEHLTHLNLAFLNPDSQGNLEIGGEDIGPVVSKARSVNSNIQVFISLAGGGLTAEWAAAYDQLMQPANRTGFVHSLIQYVELHDLDGIDVDLEWDNVNSLYSPFVIELADSLHAKGKLMTSAWPPTHRYPDISNAALDEFDWVNIMAYDLTGPWAPNNSGQHSPYSLSQQGIAHWKGQGLTSDRLVLGVPFYGRSWDNGSTGQAFTFSSIVAEDPSYAMLDQVGQRFYNGIPTIQAKTALAQMETSGIMIWELGQDALGDLENFSLLTTIDEQINTATPIDPFLSEVKGKWYPNPFQQKLNLDLSSNYQGTQVQIFDLQGRRVFRDVIPTNQSTIQWNLTYIPSGVYIGEFHTGSIVQRTKLIKQ